MGPRVGPQIEVTAGPTNSSKKLGSFPPLQRHGKNERLKMSTRASSRRRRKLRRSSQRSSRTQKASKSSNQQSSPIQMFRSRQYIPVAIIHTLPRRLSRVGNIKPFGRKGSPPLVSISSGKAGSSIQMCRRISQPGTPDLQLLYSLKNRQNQSMARLIRKTHRMLNVHTKQARPEK